jgi:mannose-6-phosphate isomerase-like protein (cupin superfamily)
LGAIDRKTAEHYTWGNGCEGWHLVRDDRLSVIEERMPPGAGEVAHYHHNAQQFFYVLSGEALLEVDGKEARASAGQGVHIPAGVPHRIKNTSSEAVRFIVISSPPSHGDRVLVEI